MLLTYFQNWELGLSIRFNLVVNNHTLLNLVWLIFLSSSTIFGYAQPWWALFNHSQCGYNHNGIKRWNGFSLLGTNLSIFINNYVKNQLFSIISLFTFKFCYKIMVLNLHHFMNLTKTESEPCMVQCAAAVGKRGWIWRVYLLVPMGLRRVSEDLQHQHEN